MQSIPWYQYFWAISKITERENILIQRWIQMPAETVGTDCPFAFWTFKNGKHEDSRLFFENNKVARLKEISAELRTSILTRAKPLGRAPRESPSLSRSPKLWAKLLSKDKSANS
jgi:hypothetical protein